MKVLSFLFQNHLVNFQQYLATVTFKLQINTSNHMNNFNNDRRRFIKGAAATLALSALGTSGMGFYIS
jgi:hypothetical protein